MSLAAVPRQKPAGRHAGAEENKAILTLDEAGNIRGCNGEIQQISGFAQHDLVARHVSMLLPRLKDVHLVDGTRLNPRLHYLCRIGFSFKLHCRYKDDRMCQLSLVDLGVHQEQRRIVVIVTVADTRASPN